MLSTQIENRAFRAVGSPLFDEDGYLLRGDLWTERLAVEIADTEGIGPLTDRHWQVLNYVRAKYLEIGALPSPRRVCRETAVAKSEIQDLFGGCLPIWRVAGLPNPGEEAKAYLS